jgi:hypothetical protein
MVEVPQRLYDPLCGARLQGTTMKARHPIQSASYDPDQLRALREAFDGAWARISPNVSSRAKAIEAARLALADVILGLAKNGNLDPKHLADAAVQVMANRSSRFQR